MAEQGKGEELKGRFQKAAGEIANDPALKHKGTVEKISGNIKQAVEHAKERVEKIIDRNKSK